MRQWPGKSPGARADSRGRERARESELYSDERKRDMNLNGTPHTSDHFRNPMDLDNPVVRGDRVCPAPFPPPTAVVFLCEGTVGEDLNPRLQIVATQRNDSIFLIPYISFSIWHLSAMMVNLLLPHETEPCSRSGAHALAHSLARSHAPGAVIRTLGNGDNSVPPFIY